LRAEVRRARVIDAQVRVVWTGVDDGEDGELIGGDDDDEGCQEYV
jgi:hypothetical protein